MRQLIAIALVLAAACGRDDRSDARDAHDAPSAPQSRAPDALVLRVPRAGGTAQVFAYPRLDSLIWTSSEPAPALDRILAFDDDGGVIAAVDSRGRPIRIELRAGSVSRLASVRLAAQASSNADAVFGLDESGTVVRHTPAGRWTFKPPHPAVGVFPQNDGSLLVLGDGEERSVVWRLRPPESRIIDSVTLPSVERAIPAQGSDRLYFATEDGLAALRTRTLEVRMIPAADSLHALVTTPSGDRVFMLRGQRSDKITIVDRYRDQVEREVTLPGSARQLRMDPIGRYLLAGNESRDSAWVVAIGTGRVIGSVRTAWRGDLPFVAVDGAVATLQGENVVWVDGETLRQISRVDGGASDFWFAFRWNGFRPRDPSLDQPVSFGNDSDSVTVVVDSGAARRDSVGAADSVRPPAPSGWTVSFAVLLSEQRARDLASQIRVAGQSPRVIASPRDGATVYRVVMGPFPTREEADRAARESKQQSYWIYEGAP